MQQNPKTRPTVKTKIAEIASRFEPPDNPIMPLIKGTGASTNNALPNAFPYAVLSFTFV